MNNILKKFLFILCVLIPFVMVIKGNKTDSGLSYQYGSDTAVGGPFETSNNTSRYALTKAIVEDQTIYFDEEESKFALPDLASKNGKYFSIFTPGVSFVGVPFYLIGDLIRLPQLFSYFSTTLFAIFNLYIIYKLSGALGAGKITSLISGLTFIFATNGLAYSQTFTQHHYSTAAILSAIYLTSRPPKISTNILLGLVFGAAVLFDIPNAFMLLPVGIWFLSKHLTVFQDTRRTYLKVNSALLAVIIGLFPMFGLFAWYNLKTSGSPILPAQVFGRTKTLEKIVQPDVKITEKTHDLAYNPRNLINGINILFFTDERGWLYYSPILAIGVLGLYISFRQKNTPDLIRVIFSVIFIDFISYSMFGDPWGGWSFGPRYLIPASALVCTGIGYILTTFKKNYLVLIGFLILVIPSIFINFLGVLTTNAVPPRVEAIAMASPIPHNYSYNYKLITNKFNSSLIYNLTLSKYLSSTQYLYLLTYITSLMFISLLIIEYRRNDP